MQVRSIDYSTRFHGVNNLTQKIIKGALKDNTEVAVRITLNNENAVQGLEAYKLLGDRIIGGFGIGSKKGISNIEVEEKLLKMQKETKDGVDLVAEYKKALGK